MSVILMGAVKQRGPQQGPLRHTLLVICDEADDFGFCAPSIETIAAGSCCSLRQAIRRIQSLENDGWIKVKRKIFRGEMANAYFVDTDKLGVPPAKQLRRSPMWNNFVRMIQALESRDKVSLLNGRLQFEKTPESLNYPQTGDLFESIFASDTMSLENEAETGPEWVQNGAKQNPASAIAAQTAPAGVVETNLEDSAGDMVSRDMCHPRHVTSDIEGEPFNVLTRSLPVEEKTTTPPTPVPGDASGEELVLPHADCRYGDGGFEISLDVAARWVLLRNGVVSGMRSNRRLLNAVVEAMRLRAKTSRQNLEEIAGLAEANLREYQAAQDLLKFSWGLVRFFSEGHWQRQRTWRYDQEKLLRLHGSGVGRRVEAEPAAQETAAEEWARIAAYLVSLAADVEAAGGDGGVVAELRGMAGEGVYDATALERRLEVLEDRLVQTAETALSEEEVAELRKKADALIAPYKARMRPEMVAQEHRRVIERELVALRGLPRLGLFYMSSHGQLAQTKRRSEG